MLKLMEKGDILGAGNRILEPYTLGHVTAASDTTAKIEFVNCGVYCSHVESNPYRTPEKPE